MKAYVMSVASYNIPTMPVVSEQIEKSMAANPKTKEISQLLKEINKNWIDWNDAKNLTLLNEILNVNWETKEWLKETKKSLVESFRKSLEDGYTILKSTDQQALNSILKTIGINIDLPEYSSLLSLIDKKESTKNGFSVILKWDRLYVYWDIDGFNSDFAWEIKDWKLITWANAPDFLDDYGINNNEIDLEDIAKTAGIAEIRENNDTKIAKVNTSKKADVVLSQEESSEILDSWLSSEVNDLIENNNYLSTDNWQVHYEINWHDYFFTINRNPKMSENLSNWEWKDEKLTNSWASTSLMQWMNSKK